MAHFGYRLAARVTHRLPGISGKLAQSLYGRRQAATRWMRWAASERTDNRLIWVHAASVGESLVASAVTSRLVARLPRLQLVRSFSSPSAMHWADPMRASHADFIPLDEPKSVARALDAVRPTLVVFARADLWPEFVVQAASRHIPVAVIGATVSAGSRRLDWPTRQILRAMHRHVSWLGAVTAEDSERYVSLGVPRDRVDVTGDPRHDQIAERVLSLNAVTPVLDWRADTDLLVAGSTDRVDGDVVLNAFSTVSRAHPSTRLLIVPHEPTSGNVADLLTKAAARHITAAPWGSGRPPRDVSCVIVTSRGDLADFYALASLAYVGGGLRGGVHAVAEPAIFAVPVVFGPRYQASRDATSMVHAGGAIVIPDQNGAADRLADTWLRWVRDPAARTAAGLNARRTLSTGAADVTARSILSALD